MRFLLRGILHAANFNRPGWISAQSLISVSVPTAKSMGDSRCCRLRKTIWAPAKTKVWGSANQYDIQINLRRMEQFVLVNLCCHSWLEPVAADRRLQ
jgi:hypothetical protein